MMGEQFGMPALVNGHASVYVERHGKLQQIKQQLIMQIVMRLTELQRKQLMHNLLQMIAADQQIDMRKAVLMPQQRKLD